MKLWCLLFGHADELRTVPGHLAVECTHCGRVSRGITLGHPSYRRTQAPKGDPQRLRRRLARVWLAHRLSDAA